MALRAIGKELDQGRSEVRARAIGCPAHGCKDRERVIPVDAHSCDAVAERALGEGRMLAAGNAGEA